MRLILLTFFLLQMQTTILASKESSIVQVINLYGQTLKFPAPNWVPNNHPKGGIKLSKLNKIQKGNLFLFEMVPMSEDFQNWKTFYGVAAQRDGRMDVQSMEKQVVASYAKACTKLDVEHVQIAKQGTLILLYCLSYKSNNRVGELGVFRIIKSGDVTVRVFHEWRGAAFVREDKESWPVEWSSVSKVVKNFVHKVQITKSP